jgi:hypothetical protein
MDHYSFRFLPPRGRRDSFDTNPLEDFPERYGENSQLEVLYPPAELKKKVAQEPNFKGVQQYSYQPLPQSHCLRLIRLLNFVPAEPLSQDGTLFCTMETFTLSNCPAFAAVSYTWGPPMYSKDTGLLEEPFHSAKIECDGTALSITSNLFRCLVQLFKNSGSSQYIWADAICIDQLNLKEKGSQLLLMGEIYSRAETVFVWLGSDASDYHQFAAVGPKLFKTIESSNLSSEAIELGQKNPMDPVLLAALNVDINSWKSMWKTYFNFFRRRRWFRRAWIIQEVALGQKILFMCGDHILLAEYFYDVGRTIRNYEWRHKLAASVDVLSNTGGIGDEGDRLLDYRDQVLCGGPQDPLMKALLQQRDGANSAVQYWHSYLQYMLQEARRFNTSDVRDHIYAVIGIVDRFLPEGMFPPIIPDYGLTASEIYTSVTKLIIEALPVLSTLSYVKHNPAQSLHILPSWVPDYSRPLEKHPLFNLGDGSFFDASKCANSKHTAKFSPENRIHMKGIWLDSIPNYPVHRYRVDFPLHGSAKIWLDELNDHSAGFAITREQRREAFWRTLIADTTARPSPTHPAPAEYEQYFNDWMKVREKVIENNDATTKSAASDNLPDGAYRFDRAIREVCTGRKLFTTSLGYLGVGPSNLKDGDHIFILIGSRVPFILRDYPLGEGFELIGEAYIHGWMHGEVFDTSFKNKIANIEIV